MPPRTAQPRPKPLPMRLETMLALPTSLEESTRRFPLPDGEVRRFDLRKWILNYVPKGGVGAEIGCFRGHFSEHLLQWLEPRKVFFVDPWTLHGEFYGPEKDPQLTNDGLLPTAVARQEARWRTQRFAEVDSVCIEGFFPACAAQIDDRLDWLYIDAELGIEETLAALQATEDLLSPKGILFGNGWWPNTTTSRNAVFQAVTMFTRKTKYEIVAAGPYGQWALRHRGAWKAKK
jgi:hypothetical protein